MGRLNICIDIDGTITSPYHFIPYLNEIYNKNIKEEECVTYNWEQLYGDTMDEILNKFHSSCMHSYEEAEIVEYAKDVIEKWLANSHNLYFVTARDKSLTEITTKWLNDKGFSDIDVHLLGSHDKIAKAKELECNVFIEDNPSNAMQLANEGMKILLINTNYNQGVEHDNITRVDTWKDIDKFIELYK